MVLYCWNAELDGCADLPTFARMTLLRFTLYVSPTRGCTPGVFYRCADLRERRVGEPRVAEGRAATRERRIREIHRGAVEPVLGQRLRNGVVTVELVEVVDEQLARRVTGRAGHRVLEVVVAKPEIQRQLVADLELITQSERRELRHDGVVRRRVTRIDGEVLAWTGAARLARDIGEDEGARGRDQRIDPDRRARKYVPRRARRAGRHGAHRGQRRDLDRRTSVAHTRRRVHRIDENRDGAPGVREARVVVAERVRRHV